MIDAPSTRRPSRRALLLGPAFDSELAGGLPLALNDVVAQLRGRGWQIDSQIWSTPAQEHSPKAAITSWRTTITHTKLTVFQSSPLLLSVWMNAIPLTLRRLLSTVFFPHAHFEHLSHNLYAAERLLADAQEYDVVLFCVDSAPPGMSALVAARHARVAIISLGGLGQELGAGWWRWGRLIGRCHLHQAMHPLLFRRIDPAQVQLAIFAGARWQHQAVQAGLAPTRARTIYFGIPQPAPQPRSTQNHCRILWVGRLTPEKGLHLLLRALPAIRQKHPDATLTIIAGPGSNAYRQLIMGMTRRYRLEDVTRILPPMERAALQTAYATHDVLFFHSIFAEPVSLLLMEAYAAGLPVVASRAWTGSKLVQDRVTCLCYRPDDCKSLTEAVVTMLGDSSLRQRLAANAQQLVRHAFTLESMGQAYDQALRQFVDQSRA